MTDKHLYTPMAEREVQQPMTVQELIEALQKYPGHLPVYISPSSQWAFRVYDPDPDADYESISFETPVSRPVFGS